MDNSEPARETSYPALVLDLSEPHYRTLADYARGIRDLLSMPAAGSSPELAGSIDDLLGAIYALIHAKRHHFKDRDRPINIKPVAQRAGRMQGQVLFYLGESGFVKEFRLPPLLPILEQLNRLAAQQPQAAR